MLKGNVFKEGQTRTLKVKTLTEMKIDGKIVGAGKIMDLPNAFALEMINAGRVEKFVPEKETKK